MSPSRRVETLSLVAAACWAAAASTYIATEAMSAAAFTPAYSYARNYISDLGVPDCGTVFDGRAICSPLHGLMNAGFVLQGLFFIGGAVAIARWIRGPMRYSFIGLAVLNGVGLGLIGLFPESAEPTVGLHLLGACLAIVFGNATALMSAFAFREFGLPGFHRRAGVALPAIAAAAFVTLLVARGTGMEIGFPEGTWERLSVYTITAWEFMTAFCLLIPRTAS